MQYLAIIVRYICEPTDKGVNIKTTPMEDIDTTKDFSNHSDEELMYGEVIGDNSDLYFIHCCLTELFTGDADDI